MRNLFLLLVLANLGFAAWHSWFAAPSPAPAQVTSAGSGVPSLTLVSEAERTLGAGATSGGEEVPGPVFDAAAEAGGVSTADSVRAADEPGSTGAARASGETGNAADTLAGNAPAAPPGQARCISVGPFRELAQAAAAAATLRDAGYEPTQRVAEGDIWVGYWVYLAGIPTREEANEQLARLQENDISDSYVTPGDAGYLISLGVFSEIARAGRRREEVRALGLEPTVVDRTRRGTVYWVDLSLAAGQTLDLESLQTPGRITRLEQRSCDATGA